MIKKLDGHKYANCYVDFNDSGMDLWSYTTRVLTVRYDNNSIILNCTGLYSMTTRKHIGWFISEWFASLSYYDIKKAFEGNYSIILNKATLEGDLC